MSDRFQLSSPASITAEGSSRREADWVAPSLLLLLLCGCGYFFPLSLSWLPLPLLLLCCRLLEATVLATTECRNLLLVLACLLYLHTHRERDMYTHAVVVDLSSPSRWSHLLCSQLPPLSFLKQLRHCQPAAATFTGYSGPPTSLTSQVLLQRQRFL